MALPTLKTREQVEIRFYLEGEQIASETKTLLIRTRPDGGEEARVCVRLRPVFREDGRAVVAVHTRCYRPRGQRL